MKRARDLGEENKHILPPFHKKSFLRCCACLVRNTSDRISSSSRILQEDFKTGGIFVLAQSVPEIFQLYRDQFLPRHGLPVEVTPDLIGAD